MEIALVTCERPPVPDVDLPPLTRALKERGARPRVVSWSDRGVDWESFDLAVICSTWDYHERLDDFRAWLERAGASTRLRNPRELVEWNLDKRYLRELAKRGVPVIPTVWAEPGEAGAAAEEAAERGWDQLVVKPVVDLGAANLVKVGAGDAADAIRSAGAPCLVQPYLESVAREGELSLMRFGGVHSHAVRKLPAAGDFRVQEHHGGEYSLVDADPAELALADRALAAAGAIHHDAADPLYARVDVVAGPDGPCVIELELIEPAFYLHVADEAESGRAADAIVTAAASP